MKALTQPLKWHGGKHDLAAWIISHFPPRCTNPNAPAADDPGWLHYVEPYAGGLSVLLANDPEGISEVVGDKNGPLVNFWRCLQHRQSFAEFAVRAATMPFSKAFWDEAVAKLERGCDVGVNVICRTCALAFFIHCRQSLAGRGASFAPRSRSRTRRGMNEQVAAWLGAVDGLAAVHERLMRVLILDADALTVIRQEDGPRTLFYLDPPYLHETRTSTGEYGLNEMSELQHVDLLKLLGTIKGRFLLSGYRSELYDTYAVTSGWKCYEKRINNHAASGKTKRVMTECLYCNF